MAGPWFVDPEGGATTNNGLSVDTPWKLIPGQTGASSQTGYGVVAGDVINIKNGTTSAGGTIVPPADNLTYRGYGLAKNILELILPNPIDCTQTIKTYPVREIGVHEGMWRLVNNSITGSHIATSTRSGTVIEDLYVDGTTASSPISLGYSSSTAIGATLRRCWVNGGAAAGIEGYTRQHTLEDIRIENIQDDALTVGSVAANGYRAGYKDTYRRICIIEPGIDLVGATGDAFQTYAESNRFESVISMEDIYIKKSNTIKQAIVFQDVLNGFTLTRYHFTAVPASTINILCTGLRGKVRISKGYIKQGLKFNAVLRYAGSQGIASTGEILFEHNIIDTLNHEGLFYWGGSTDTATIDGSVIIRNNYIKGTNVQNLSFSGTTSCHPGALITLGAGCSWLVENNIFDVDGAPIARLPVGGANDARWVFRNNAVKAGGKYAIGTTEYTSIAAFQAAHNAATGNFESDFDLTPNYRINPGADLIEAGIHSGYRTDFLGTQLWNPPSVGPLEYIR